MLFNHQKYMQKNRKPMHKFAYEFLKDKTITGYPSKRGLLA